MTDQAQDVVRDALREGAWTLPRNDDAAASDVMAGLAAAGLRITRAVPARDQGGDLADALGYVTSLEEQLWREQRYGEADQLHDVAHDIRAHRCQPAAAPGEAEQQADDAFNDLRRAHRRDRATSRGRRVHGRCCRAHRRAARPADAEPRVDVVSEVQ